MTDRKLEDIMANLALETEKTRLMQQETEREMKEMFAETRAMFAETRAMFAETRLMQQKTDLQIKEVSRQLGGMGNSNGDFAEEFFYNSLKETMTFAGIHFDMISDKFRTKKIMPDKTEKKAQFDIVLHNGDSLALIEAKYKAELEDVTEMVEKKVPNFRLLYPQYEKYKLYLGIGSLVLKDRIVQEAQKLGIGLMEQRGDAVEHKNEWVRAY